MCYRVFFLHVMAVVPLTFHNVSNFLLLDAVSSTFPHVDVTHPVKKCSKLQREAKNGHVVEGHTTHNTTQREEKRREEKRRRREAKRREEKRREEKRREEKRREDEQEDEKEDRRREEKTKDKMKNKKIMMWTDADATTISATMRGRDSMGRVFLSRSRSARQLSESQSVASAHV